MASAAYLWTRIINYIETNYSASVAEAWFDDVEAVEFTGGTLVLYTPRVFWKPILETECAPYIQEAMLSLMDQPAKILILDDLSSC